MTDRVSGDFKETITQLTKVSLFLFKHSDTKL